MITIRGDEKLESRDLYLAKSRAKSLVYTRVSSDDQTENYSLESQIDNCVEYAVNKLGYTKDEILIFREEGEMGDNPDRPALNYMLNLLAKEKIGQTVIIYDSDRLARDNFLQRFILNQILEAGASLKIVRDEGFNPFDENSMLQFNIKGVLAEYYKRKIHSETKRGRMTKVTKHKKMMGVNRVYGYTYDKEEDILVINEEEADIIKRMVSMLLEDNYSCSKIAKVLSREGVAAPKGNVWYQATISRLLRNEVIMGKFYYGKSEVIQIGGKKKQIPVPKDKWIEIPIPSIVDSATFERVQRKLDGARTASAGRPSETLLRGIGKCEKCGGALVIGQSSKTKNGKLRYYTCTKQQKSGYTVGTGKRYTKCETGAWRQDIVDQKLWEYLVDRLKNPEKIIEDIVKQQGDIQQAGTLFKKRKDIEKKLEEQETVKDRYFDLYAMGKITSQADLDKKLKPIEDKTLDLKVEMEILDEKLKYITINYDELEMLKNKINEYKELVKNENAMTFEEKKTIVNLFVKKVVLTEDGFMDVDMVYNTNLKTFN